VIPGDQEQRVAVVGEQPKIRNGTQVSVSLSCRQCLSL
jgi:hypothetical protein